MKRGIRAEMASTDPAGNKILTRASGLAEPVDARLGDDYFVSRRRNESAKAAIFTRKVGYTQRRAANPVRSL